MALDHDEARQLAALVRSEPGWHAEVRHNIWTDLWLVRAWTDAMAASDGEDGEDGDFYTLRTRGDWYRIWSVLPSRDDAPDETTPASP